MSIEISNHTVASQPLEPAKETKTGDAQIRAPKTKQETGKGVDSLTVTENAATYEMNDSARLFQQAYAAISQAPVVDTNKVAAGRAKVRDLQNNINLQFASAEAIAGKIMDAFLPNTTKNS